MDDGLGDGLTLGDGDGLGDGSGGPDGGGSVCPSGSLEGGGFSGSSCPGSTGP